MNSRICLRIASIRNKSNQRTQMIMTMDVNKITRLMGLTIMQASKNFECNRMLRIFGRSNDFSRIGDIHESTGGERIFGKCEKLSVGVFM